MITIKDLDIRISGFRILPIHNYFDLTTADSSYQISPDNGGIRVNPQLEITGIEKGKFYITQICNSHNLVIEGKSGNTYPLIISKDHCDNSNLTSGHYKSFTIKNNQISLYEYHQSGYMFFDAPYRELMKHHDSIRYDIKFTTMFQYSLGSDTSLIPLIKFNWWLECEARNSGSTWEIISEKYSTVNEIRDSIENLHGEGLNPAKLPNLYKAVIDFKNSSPELKNDYQG